jgi:hypothetical protein
MYIVSPFPCSSVACFQKATHGGFAVVIVQFLVFVVVAGCEELRCAEEDLFTVIGHGR